MGRVWVYGGFWALTDDIACCNYYDGTYSLTRGNKDDYTTVVSDLLAGDDQFATNWTGYYRCGTGAYDPLLVILPDSSPWNSIIFEVDGGAGNDAIAGAYAADWISGGSGGDIIYGGPGLDHLYGDGGSDILYGGYGDDYLYGSDNVCSTADNSEDWLVGEDGSDHLYGCAGNCDYLLGGSGDGTDTCDGGTGTYDLCLQCEGTILGCESSDPSCEYY